MFLQETYVIEDNSFWDNALTNRTSNYIPMLCEGGSFGTIEHNIDCYAYNHGSKTTMVKIPIELPKNCIIEGILKRNSGSIGLCILKDTGNTIGAVIYADEAQTYRYNNSVRVESFKSVVYHTFGTEYHKMTIIKTDLSIVVKIDDTQIFSKTLPFNNSDPLFAGIIGNASVNGCFKEIKIKTL